MLLFGTSSSSDELVGKLLLVLFLQLLVVASFNFAKNSIDCPEWVLILFTKNLFNVT